MASESKGTVLVALSANVVIAVMKFVGGSISGSAAMVAEGAHSVADTLNEILLWVSINRSERPADRRHPFGYGRERFFWSLLAAVGIFVLGAGFSFIEGFSSLRSGEPPTNLWIPFLVLGLSALAEGTSWLKAVRQIRGEARQARRGPLEYVRISTDPSVKTVAVEDSAALIGLVLAALGLGLDALFGTSVFDGLASIAIGVLLIVVAVGLGRQNRDLLIGRSAEPRTRSAIEDLLRASPAVSAVVDVFTTVVGPDRLVVAARIDLRDDLTGAQIERLVVELTRQLREQVPEVADVFLSPISSAAASELPEGRPTAIG